MKPSISRLHSSRVNGSYSRHAAVGEPGQHQAAGPGVVGLVGIDRRQRDLDRRRRALLVVEGQHADVAGAEAVVVLGETLHVGVAGREPRAAPPLGVRDRALLAQVVPHRVRVGDVVGVEDVVVGRPVVDGRCPGAVWCGVLSVLIGPSRSLAVRTHSSP